LSSASGASVASHRATPWPSGAGAIVRRIGRPDGEARNPSGPAFHRHGGGLNRGGMGIGPPAA
jgi:hypothetical protein